MKRSLIAVAALSLLLTASSARALTKGGSMLAIQIGQGTADVVDPALGAGVWQPVPTSENRASLELWHAVSDDYAFNIAAGGGYFTQKQEPADKTVNNTITNTVTSYRVRIGGDRFGQVGDRLTIFLGPGVEYWGGKLKEKYEDGPIGTRREETSPSTSRVGVSGRIGGFIKLSDSVSLTGQIGHTFGYASVDKNNAKTTWWPGSFDGAGGLAFGFGSAK